jgi:hypothetical protein
MAAAAQRPHREEVTFPPNTPVTVALKYAQGKVVSSAFGERIMYGTIDNRVMFLDIDVAAQIVELGINVRESFSITKRWDGRKDSPVSWEVARIPGEQPNGTFVVPRSHAAESSGAAVTPKPPAPADAATSDAPRRQTSRELLVEEANSLVDAYAEVLHRSLSKHEGRVKPDEIRSILITAYIQRNKLSSAA